MTDDQDKDLDVTNDDLKTTEDDLGEPDPSEGDQDSVPDTVLNLLPELRRKKKNEKFLDATFLAQITGDLKEGEDGRAGWMEKTRIRTRLWSGDLEPKKFPYDHCANMHDPVMLSRCLRLVARLIKEVFKKGQPLFSASASSHISTEQADAITRHQNHQFRKEIPDFQRHCTRAAHAFFRDGDVVMHSYRDTKNNVNRHDYLKHDSFVYPYAFESTATDMSDVPWKIKIVYKYARQLRELAASGRYDATAVAKLLNENKDGDAGEGDVDRPLLEQANEFEGADPSAIKRDVPYTLLEYYGWVRLPGDKEDIPVIAVLAKGSNKLLAIYSRYYDDPEDRGRCDRQEEEYRAYMAEVEMFKQAMDMEGALLERVQQPDVPPEEAQEVAQAVERQRPPIPVRPDWMGASDGQPKPCKKKIIEPFTHMVCIENPDGSYGLGVAMLIEPHQMAMNTLMNQVVDQATMANARPHLKHHTLQLPSGTETLEPGAIIEVTGVAPGTIRDNLVAMDVPPANPQLIQAVENQRQAVDSVSSAPDVLSGERSSDETFRGQSGRIEQATMQLSMFGSNFVGGLSNIARNNMLLDYMFIDEDATIDVIDTKMDKMVPLRIRRDFYRARVDITFGADLEFKSSAARVAEADDLVGLLTKGFPPQIAMLIFPPKIYAEVARMAIAARGAHNLLAMVNSDEEIEAKLQQQQAAPPPGGPPTGGPPKGPTPSVPTGQPGGAPGQRPPQTALPPGVPQQGAPLRTT